MGCSVVFVFFFKQKTAYEMLRSLVGSEMCIRDRGCRIIAELGADLIKTYCTIKFDEVTKACPAPILGLGAEKTPRQIQALELAERIIKGGGRGVVFGRNAIQVDDPAAFQRTLVDVVQGGKRPSDAAAAHALKD